MEQIFLNEKCKFYAREAKGTTPQMMYCNININGERIVISTGVKVIPNQFSAKKQRALISNDLTELENRNNVIVNDTISFFKTKFTDFVKWLMMNPDKISELKENIYNFVPMKKNGNNNGKKNGKKFEETLDFIFGKELEMEVAEKTISADRKDVKTTHLKAFFEFLQAKNIENVWASLTLDNFRQFSNYLVNERRTNKGNSLNISTINNHLSTLKAVVNAVCDRDTKIQPIDTSRWKLVKTQITTSEKKSTNYIFTDEQLNNIIRLELEGNAEIVRDIFVFGCYVGQRPSDNVRLLNGEGKRFVSNGIEVFSLLPHKTRKTDKTAFVPLFSDNIKLVDAIINRFKTDPDYKEFLKKSDKQRNALNAKWIKRIFELAGLNDSFEATRQRGNEVSKEEESQASTAHVYLARHYFITYMCRHGVSESDVIEMTGHTSTKQISETYSHLSIEEQASKLTSSASIQRLAGVSNSQTANNTPQVNEIDGLIQEIKLCKMGFYNKISSPVKSKIKETAIFNNCSLEKACDILLENLK